MDRFGKPEIFNTDQGSQFTYAEWIDVLRDANVNISMEFEAFENCSTGTIQPKPGEAKRPLGRQPHD